MLQHGKRPTIASRHGMVAAAHPLAGQPARESWAMAATPSTRRRRRRPR
jgi:hypothetical protein